MQDAFDEEEEERAEENEQEKQGTNDEDLDREDMLYWEVRIRFNIILSSRVEPQIRSFGASDHQIFEVPALRFSFQSTWHLMPLHPACAFAVWTGPWMHRLLKSDLARQVSVGSQQHRSRLAPLQSSGIARWDQDFAFAVVLPLKTRPLMLELHESRGGRRKGRTIARAYIPLAELFPNGMGECTSLCRSVHTCPDQFHTLKTRPAGVVLPDAMTSPLKALL